MNIKIENAWGEDGEIMTLYRNNEMITSIAIDSTKNDPPETLLDYLIEFNLQPSKLGINTHTFYLEKEENFENNGTLVWIL